jgi:hypothetical protein
VKGYVKLDFLLNKLYTHGIVLAGGAPLAIATKSKFKDFDFVGVKEHTHEELKEIFSGFRLFISYKWPRIGYEGCVFCYGNFHCQYLGYNAHHAFDITTAQNILLPGLILKNCKPPSVIERNLKSIKGTQRRLAKYNHRWAKLNNKFTENGIIDNISLMELMKK